MKKFKCLWVALLWAVLLMAFSCGDDDTKAEQSTASIDDNLGSDTVGDSDVSSDDSSDLNSDVDTGTDTGTQLSIELVAVEWNTNCYLLGDDERIAIIDPGSRADLIEAAVDGRTVEYLILTHGHFDHIVALDDLVALYPDATVAIHADDAQYLFDISLNLSTHYTGEDYVFGGTVDQYLEGEELLHIAGNSVRVIHTPGHSPGSICLLNGKMLLSGDTLMFEKIGYIEDVPLLDRDQLIESIQKKLFVLDEDIQVYPGHGATTTIGHEKENNPDAAQFSLSPIG